MKIAILLSSLLTFITIFASQSNSEADWKWAGIEIVGHKTVARESIAALIPLKMGSAFSVDMPQWNNWCAKIKSSFGFHYTNCSAVRYPDKKAYFTISIVEQGDEHHLAFREAPTGSVPLANEQVLLEYQALNFRWRKLFDEGNLSVENANKGYLNYSDAEMSAHVARLVQLVPPYRHNLLDVIKSDADPLKREKAAKLLNWALSTEDSIKEVLNYLDDPDSTVRNNISRFMLHYFKDVKSTKLRRQAITRLAEQLWWPSHGDRNKAVYGLWEIARSHPSDLEVIETEAREAIAYLARTSILSNVQSLAQELLKLFDKQDQYSNSKTSN